MEIDEGYIAEAATDYYSPCCYQEGIYAHFYSSDGLRESEVLSGFQCTGCGRNFDVSYKDEFET